MRETIKSLIFAAVHLAAVYAWAVLGNQYLLNLHLFAVWFMLPLVIIGAGLPDLHCKMAAEPAAPAICRWINRAWRLALLGALVAHAHWLTAAALLLGMAFAAATHAAVAKIRAEAGAA